jgi:hypothetical protein
VTAVGSDGSVDFTNGSTQSVDLVVDLSGYFGTTGTESFVPISPTRYVDTRKKFGAYTGNLTSSGAVAADGTLQGGFTPSPGITAVPQWAMAVAANVTATQPSQAGYIEAYPSQDQTPPGTSSLNFTAGATVANAATLSAYSTDFYNGSPGTVQLIVDVAGYYS